MPLTSKGLAAVPPGRHFDAANLCTFSQVHTRKKEMKMRFMLKCAFSHNQGEPLEWWAEQRRVEARQREHAISMLQREPVGYTETSAWDSDSARRLSRQLAARATRSSWPAGEGDPLFRPACMQFGHVPKPIDCGKPAEV